MPLNLSYTFSGYPIRMFISFSLARYISKKLLAMNVLLPGPVAMKMLDLALVFKIILRMALISSVPIELVGSFTIWTLVFPPLKIYKLIHFLHSYVCSEVYSQNQRGMR